MVRVNSPPGGETNFNGETKPLPQTVRVLKPPGGGSSISFGGDEDTIEIARQPKSLTTTATVSPTETTSPTEKVINGPTESPKEDAPLESKITPAAETNGTSTTETTSTVATPSTPSSGRPEGDTKIRLFGEDNTERGTPNRKVKNHMRSSIFQGDESKTEEGATTNGNSKNAVPVTKSENDKPSEPEPVQLAPTRQRVPPGGFSTKLW